MLTQVAFNPNAYRTPTGIKGLKIVTGKHKITEFEIAQNRSDSSEDLKKIGHGINTPFECSLREVMMKSIPEENKVDASINEMLTNLRGMFNIPVIIIGSKEDDIPDSVMRANTPGTYRKFRISEEMLKRMSEDPGTFQDITEKMNRWLDGTCEFLAKHEGAIDRMEMYISEYGIMYAYTENYDAPASAVKEAKVELNDLLDFFLKWIDERNRNSTEKADNEKEKSEEDTSEHIVETILSS